MLNVYVAGQVVGCLFKPESNPEKFHFGYAEQCLPQNAVSLCMPVVREQYASGYKALHPVFDMNLPEGVLAERLRREFGKVIPDFDALALLKIVGQSQIGRLRYAMPGQEPADVPAESVNDLLAHDGAEGLFESLLCRYAVHSGISGAQPKVLVRDDIPIDSRLTHRGATHIVKAWTEEYPRLAENEFFCLRAALHAGLEVPAFELSKEGLFLVVERFDLRQDNYLGFEDFCSLNGKTAGQKYDGSYEGITKRICDFVSPQQVRPALESFFKALVLSCALKNGDAHLKNFGVLYDDAESAVRLAPIYDVVTTTAYMPSDILALTLAGSKRWPPAKALTAFARSHCHLTDQRARQLMADAAQGIRQAATEVRLYLQQHPAFHEIGTRILAQWQQGMALSMDEQNGL